MAPVTSADVWPTELRLRKDRRHLAVAFDSGESFELSAEYLRVKSPSAEVQGHMPPRNARPSRANETWRSSK